MKKKSLFKRVAALAMSAMMVLGMTATTTAATIDTTQRGSLEIEKYRSRATEQDPLIPIEGVEFKFVKVGEFAQTPATAENKMEVSGFKVGENLAAILDGLDKDVQYDGSVIENAFETALADEQKNAQIKELVNTVPTTQILTTNEFGKTGQATIAGGDFGIYLVVETNGPETIDVTKAKPFLVSVPMADPDGGSEWIYDVVAQPKNDYNGDITIPDPDKTVSDVKTETPDTGMPIYSQKVGEDVTFTIHTTVPASDHDILKFDLVDTMSKGLTYKAEGMVVEAKENGKQEYTDITDLNKATNPDNGIFTVNAVPKTDTEGQETGETVLTISFDPAKLQDGADNTRVYTDIKVTYKATINASAVVGDVDENTNDFLVSYTNNPDEDQKIDNPVPVRTYGFQIQKTGTNNEPLSGAKFKLYDAEGKEVSFYTALDENNNVVGQPVTEVETSKDETSLGRAAFYGLASGTYHLEETYAPKGYTMLKDRVTVTVGAGTTADPVEITIVNTKGFTLPATGGMGTVIFTIGGIVLMIGAAVLLVRSNKKSRAN